MEEVTSGVLAGLVLMWCAFWVADSVRSFNRTRLKTYLHAIREYLGLEGLTKKEEELRIILKRGNESDAVKWIENNQHHVRKNACFYDFRLERRVSLLTLAVTEAKFKAAEKMLQIRKMDFLWDDDGKSVSALDIMVELARQSREDNNGSDRLNRRYENHTVRQDLQLSIPALREKFFINYVAEEDKERFLNPEEIRVSFDLWREDTEGEFFLRLKRGITNPTELVKDLPRKLNANAKVFFRPKVTKINPDGTTTKEYKKQTSGTTFSLLQYAVVCSNTNAVKILLRLGANPSWRNNKGSNVIQFLAKEGCVETARMILQNELVQQRHLELIDQKNINGWTPLHAACENSNALFAAWLLDLGADPNGQMTSGWTPTHAANKRNNRKIQAIIRRCGGDNSVRANSERFGLRTTPGDVFHYAREMERREAARDLLLKRSMDATEAARHQTAQRALVAMATFFEDSDENKSDVNGESIQTDRVRREVRRMGSRDGSKYDKLLATMMQEKIDCKVLLRQPVEPLEDFVARCQTEMRSGDFGCLLLIVSSHGGQDGRGQFLMDESRRRLYLSTEILDKFVRPEKCGNFMEDKNAVFIYNLCRSFSGDADADAAVENRRRRKVQSTKSAPLNRARISTDGGESEHDDDTDVTEDEDEVVEVDARGPLGSTGYQPQRETNYVQIQVTCEGGVSFRDTGRGSLPIIALKDIVRRYGAKLSLQEWVTQANEQILDTELGCVRYKGRRYFPKLWMQQATARPIYFRPRPDATSLAKRASRANDGNGNTPEPVNTGPKLASTNLAAGVSLNSDARGLSNSKPVASSAPQGPGHKFFMSHVMTHEEIQESYTGQKIENTAETAVIGKGTEVNSKKPIQSAVEIEQRLLQQNQQLQLNLAAGHSN